MKYTLPAIASGLILAGTAIAGPTGYSAKTSKTKVPPPPPAPDPCPCFGAGETDLDVFAAYAHGGDELDGEWGGGLRLSSFVSRYVGFGLSYSVIGDTPIHLVDASVILRYPIESACLAPYVYGGPGGYFNSTNEFTGHIGAGLDVRLFGCDGLFVDYKYTFADNDDFGVASVGYRWSF